ncbi:hypothetical protein [Asticcacaulis sp. EMRT-3]|uniref:hypothetical protein n=1 Tax=Asticcacaulis sp. EMRT-3 TaxID=3040349 RepID=UPI0024AFCF47|nr:hypothetical protein [Asticcacaulis sp. EMRT-3]MDI7775158.1 hypothetical protein [Asticcacaulis sp. EMRT-3]
MFFTLASKAGSLISRAALITAHFFQSSSYFQKSFSTIQKTKTCPNPPAKPEDLFSEEAALLKTSPLRVNRLFQRISFPNFTDKAWQHPNHSNPLEGLKSQQFLAVPVVATRRLRRREGGF